MCYALYRPTPCGCGPLGLSLACVHPEIRGQTPTPGRGEIRGLTPAVREQLGAWLERIYEPRLGYEGAVVREEQVVAFLRSAASTRNGNRTLRVLERGAMADRIRLSDHAASEARRRGIDEATVLEIARRPEQRIELNDRREVRQSRVVDRVSGKLHLVRVIVDRDPGGQTVVTAYRTSKLRKYWREQ